MNMFLDMVLALRAMVICWRRRVDVGSEVEGESVVVGRGRWLAPGGY